MLALASTFAVLAVGLVATNLLAAPAWVRGAPTLTSSALTYDWTNRSPPSAPSPRHYAPMTFDSRSGQVILFGGWGGAYGDTALNDTWAFDPGTNLWTNRSPATHPELYGNAPGTAAMVYNSRWDRVILVGGCSSRPCFNPNATWSYDPSANAWAAMHPSSAPNVSHDFGLTYDAGADRVLLFGGATIAPHYYYNVVNGLMAYDYASDSWMRLSSGDSPSARLGAGLVYASQADRTILFGGCTDAIRLWPVCRMANDTWAYDSAANAWTNQTPASSPPPAVGLPMVYDGLADRLLLFGQGWGSGNATWSYDIQSNAWAAEHPRTSPPARSAPSMTYDSVDGQVLLFGGAHAGLRNDTRAYGTPTVPGGGETGSFLEVPLAVWYGAALVVAAVVVAVVAVLWTERRRRRAFPPP